MPMPALPIAYVPLAFLLVVTVGCREGADSPTGPGAETAPLAPAAATLPPFAAVSAGRHHTCALARNGAAYCWGFNSQGELGDGTSFDRDTPTPVAGGLRFSQISAGSLRTCAVTADHRAYCWGAGAATSHIPANVPTLVRGGHRFRNVNVGNDHVCAVTPDDIAFCWGSNKLGQLGSASGFTATPVRVTGGHRWRRVDAGGQYTCGVTTAFRAYCWGFSEANKRPIAVPGGLLFRQVVAGGGDYVDAEGTESMTPHACGITLEDRAYCWIGGGDGELGNGSWSGSGTPVAVSGSRRWSQVIAGKRLSCGVTTAGVAFCWGWNGFGTHGTGDTKASNTPRRVAGGILFANVSTGLGSHACGLTGSGGIYCWGENGSGQLGDGTRTSRLSPVAVAGAP